MKPYSIDFRERVLTDCDCGMPTKQVAEKYRVCPAWVRRLKQRRRETGSIAPKAQRHGPLPRRSEHAAEVAEAVQRAPDATLQELRRDHHRRARSSAAGSKSLGSSADATRRAVID